MIFLTGPHCCGKTHILRYVYRYGFPSIDLGPTLRKTYHDFSLGLSFTQWIQVGEESCGPSFTDQLVSLAVQEWMQTQREKYEGRIQDFIIAGSRSMNGIEYISNFFGLSIQNRKIVYVDANPQTLRRRYEAREGVTITPRDFEAYLNDDYKMGLLKIKARADIYLKNEGITDHELTRMIDDIIFEQLGHKKEIMLPDAEGRMSLEKEYRRISNKENL